jgi:hypothetical protein
MGSAGTGGAVEGLEHRQCDLEVEDKGKVSFPPSSLLKTEK